MKCANCQSDLPSTARFCPSCAAPAVKEEDIKSPSEVDLDWLESVLKSMGYTTEPGVAASNTLIARHSEYSTIVAGHIPKASLITFQAQWTMKKPSWTQKGEFAQMVNKANASHWLCTFFHPEEMDMITASTAMPVTERISARDVMNYLETFNTGAINAIQTSGLMKFA